MPFRGLWKNENKFIFFSFFSDPRQPDAAGGPRPSWASLRPACYHASHDVSHAHTRARATPTPPRNFFFFFFFFNLFLLLPTLNGPMIFFSFHFWKLAFWYFLKKEICWFLPIFFPSRINLFAKIFLSAKWKKKKIFYTHKKKIIYCGR